MKMGDLDQLPDATGNSRDIQVIMRSTDREAHQPGAVANGRPADEQEHSSAQTHPADEGHGMEGDHVLDWSKGQGRTTHQNDNHDISPCLGDREDVLFTREEGVPGNGLQSHQGAENTTVDSKLVPSLSSFSSLEEAFLTSLDVIGSLREVITLLLRAQGVSTQDEGRQHLLTEYDQKMARERAMQVVARTSAFSCRPQAYESLLATRKRTDEGKRPFDGEESGASNYISSLAADEQLSREENFGAIKAERREDRYPRESVPKRGSSARQPSSEKEHGGGTLECCSHTLNRDYELSICKALLMLQHLGGPEESRYMETDSPLGGFPLLPQEGSSIHLGDADTGGPLSQKHQGRQQRPAFEQLASQLQSQYFKKHVEGGDEGQIDAEASCSGADQVHAMRIQRKGGDGTTASEIAPSSATLVSEKKTFAACQRGTKRHVEVADVMEMLLKVRLLRQAQLLLRADLLMMRKQQGLQQERLDRALQAAVKRHESERDSLLCRLQKLALLLQKK